MSEPKNNRHNRRRKPTILVVDDDVNVATTLGMILEQSGFRTVVAHTSEQGLFAAISNAVDLALMDVVLPDVGSEDRREAVQAPSELQDFIVLR
jgi:DNA-binding response OmpR family regulator